MPEKIPHEIPSIAIQNLLFRWPGCSTTTLRVDSLEIGHGESVFIQGESGSGKTTLLSIIAGILSPSSGSVRVLGRELGGMPPAMRDQFRADHIGFIFQQFNLLPYLGMKDNVALVTRFSRRRRANSRKESEQEIRRCLAALGLDDHDIGTRSVRDLSVGQQQRVAIARALLGSPELVIADEPTSALDAKSRDTFLSVLFRECERSGATLLFVSHDPSLSGRFDHCLELDSGRLKTETPSQ